MPGDPLQRLLRLRQQAVEQARVALAACLKAEAEQIAFICSLDDGAIRDKVAAGELLNNDPWFGLMMTAGRARQRQRRDAAVVALGEAEAHTAKTRSHLAAARSDAEAVATLLTERRSAALAFAERRAQHELDDVARAQSLRRPDSSLK